MVVCAVKRNGIVVILDYPAPVAGNIDEAASSPICTNSPFGI
jgi:hypothetical protein